MVIILGRKNELTMSRHNRDINQNHIEKLMESMEEYGFLASKPIQVNKDKSIIDGHHRYVAANNLKIGYYYVVEPIKNHAKMIATIDKGTHKWTLTDWLKYWKNQNKQDYIKIVNALNDGYPAGGLLTIATQKAENRRDVMSGNFKITNCKFDQILHKIDQLAEILPFVKYRNEVRAIIKVYINFPEFDLNRLIHKVKKFPMIWRRAASIKESIKEIEKVYNYKARYKITFSKLYL